MACVYIGGVLGLGGRIFRKFFFFLKKGGIIFKLEKFLLCLVISKALSWLIVVADLEETITSGIIDPWVVVGTSYAGLQIDSFSGKFLGSQLAGIGHPTGWFAFNVALLPPGFEVLDFTDGAWVLHPLDDLSHGDKVDIIVVGQDFIDPVQESIQEFRIVLQPGSMEVQTKWGTILIVMAIEVVVQEVVELITGQNVGARIDHGTAGQVFIIGGILTTIQFIHNHFPDSMRTSGAALQVTVTTMGHTEVHSVGP